jgi:hypothetical protein
MILICGIDILHRFTGCTLTHQIHTNHFVVSFRYASTAAYSADTKPFTAEYLVTNKVGF